MRSLLLIVLALLPGAAFAAEITVESVLAEMNVHRVAAGLPALRPDARLLRAAEDRMREMEELAYWAHVAPDGRSPFQTVRTQGYDYRYAGENLASGFETAEVLVQSWMESKGHRDNIMSPFYKDCGVAIIDGSTLGRATGRSIVVLFAWPVDPPAPAEAPRVPEARRSSAPRR